MFKEELYGDTNFPASTFVPPEGPMDARIMIIGEAPGEKEDASGRPFVGPAGDKLDYLLSKAELSRNDVFITNVLKRRPPKNNVNTSLAQREATQSLPGLRREIHTVKPKVIVPMGNTALAALGFNYKITSVRGYVIPTEFGKIIPTFHPAAIFRQWHIQPTCVMDWVKIKRHAIHAGMPHFPEQFELNPTIEDVEMFAHLVQLKLQTGQKVQIGMDLETFYIEESALMTPIKLVGMALTESKAIVIPFITQSGQYYWKTRDEQLRAIAAISDIIENPNVEIMFHNGLFDILVMMNHGFDFKCRIYDTMLAQTMVYHPSPHTLEYLGSIYTDYPPWKQDKGKTDEEFRYYNAHDCAVLKYIRPKLDEDVSSNRVEYLVSMLCEAIIPYCRMMLNGIAVDQARWNEVNGMLSRDISAITTDIRRIAGDPAFNPNADAQIRDLLFNKENLKSQVKTAKSKQKSVKQEVLNRLSLRYPANEAVAAIQRYKHLHGQYANFVKKLFIHPDGRVHSSFKMHTVVTGRLASENPNIMNLPKTRDPEGYIRGMYAVPDGRVIVSADYSQLELMIFAEIAVDTIWLDAFANGEDVHKINGDALLGTYEERYRTFIKNFIYGLIFGSEGSAIEAVAPKELIERISVRDMIHNLQVTHPAIFEYRDRILSELNKRKYVSTAFGRKRWFPIPKPTKGDIRSAYNHPIQGTAADIMHTRVPILDSQFDHEKDKLVLQLHDEFNVETDANRVDHVANLLKQVMEEPIDTPIGITFKLTANVSYGKSLARKDMVEWQK